jgi:tellurium resistance protein TerD
MEKNMTQEQTAIVLTKGSRIDLQKTDPGLEEILIGISWGKNKSDTGAQYDVDISAFSLVHVGDSKEPKIRTNDDVLFYSSVHRTEDDKTVFKDTGPYPKKGRPCAPDLSVIHSGDNTDGGGEGYDEKIIVNVAKVLANLNEVSFVGTIFEAIERKQTFGQIPGSRVDVLNNKTGRVLASYDLEESFSDETAIQVGSLYKNPENHAAFKAVGIGYKLGLGEFCKGYGATNV